MSIVAKNIHKTFDDVKVLKGINLTIEDGEVVVLVGSSGSGKSTFLRCLNLLTRPTSGQVFIDGLDITEPGVNLNQIRQKVGMVFQNFNLFDNFSVIENIKLGPKKILHQKENEADKEARRLLKMVGLLNKADASPHNLSGGQKQRIALARALLTKSPILILDEATSGLDVLTEKKVIDNLMKLPDKTIIFVAHRLSISKRTNQIIVLDQGKVIETGSHTELIERKGFYYHLFNK